MKIKALLFPFHEGDPMLEFDWDAPGPTVTEALDQAFREFNVVREGDPHIARKCRSMSVGDVVVAGGEHWLCRGLGWEHVLPSRTEELRKTTFRDRAFL